MFGRITNRSYTKPLRKDFLQVLLQAMLQDVRVCGDLY